MYRALLLAILLVSSLTAFADCSAYICRNVLIESIHNSTGSTLSVETSGNESNLKCRPEANQLTTEPSNREAMVGDLLNQAKKHGLPTDIYLYEDKRDMGENGCAIKIVVVKELRDEVQPESGDYYKKSIPSGMDFSLLLLPQAYIERQKLSKAKDERIKLSISQDVEDKLTLKMKQWFETVKTHLNAIQHESLEPVSSLSELTGKMMKNQTSLPSDVKELRKYNDLNQASHKAFSELAVHAKNGDLDTFQDQNNKLMQLCVECHSLYRFD